jgi:excisionase family DNA binding protein
MSKISMAQAAKMFAVSRPTLAEHLKNGKISGEKDGDIWKIDVSELKRVYAYRDAKPDKVRHGDLAEPAGQTGRDLQSEIKLLQAQLDAEKQARALVERHLDDLRKLLPGPQDAAPRRGWWPFSGG